MFCCDTRLYTFTCLDAYLDVFPEAGLDGDGAPVEFAEGFGEDGELWGGMEGGEGDFAGHVAGVEEAVVGDFVDGGTGGGGGTEEGGD